MKITKHLSVLLFAAVAFSACKAKGKLTTSAVAVSEPSPVADEEPPPPPPPPLWSENPDVIALCDRQSEPALHAGCLTAVDTYSFDPLPIMQRCGEKPFNTKRAELACITAGAKFMDDGVGVIDTCVADSPNKNPSKVRDKALKCIEAAAAAQP